MMDMENSQFGLSPQELAGYREHGFLIREAVFSESELTRLRKSVELAVTSAWLQAQDGDTYYLDDKRFVDVGTMTVQFEHTPDTETIRVVEPAHQLHPDLEQLVRDPRITDPVSNIVGTDKVSIWTNKLNLKRAQEGSGFGWHQDSPYWVHDSDHVDLLPNVYLAFDDATEENGCLRVIKGSHRNGCLPGTADGSQLGGFFTSPECFDEKDAVSLTLKAGSIAFFDPHVIHGSNPNRTDHSRRAIVMTYQPAGFPMLKTGKIRDIA
jgi:hypothetical protein